MGAHETLAAARRAESGISLVEVLVAVTILALATTIALMLYDGARRSFKVGDNLTEQQQVVRIAFDELSRRVLAAGFNHNPDGDKVRPDEQIEAAYDTAIVLRGDFDADDAVESIDPEANLAAGGSFLTVSTGNDEIVGFVLAVSDTDPERASTGQLTFDADVVPVPRDGVVETVAAAKVDLAQDDPPYTLYRVRGNDDSATMTREPMIDNVRSLRFTYYDDAGNHIPAPEGADDPAGDSRRARARIRRIGIEIEALTADPDPRWLDRDDPDEMTRFYRKFKLRGDIRPRNLGLFGLRDLEANLTPPSPPPPPSVYPGHCAGFWTSWAPSPPQDEVARYQVRFGTDPAALTGLVYSVAPEVYIGGLTDATMYYVAIEAVDDSGNVSQPSPATTATTANLNTPEVGDNLDVAVPSDNPPGVVSMEWNLVTENVSPAPPIQDPLSPKLRDFGAYRIYRGTDLTFPWDPDEFLGQTVEPRYADHEVVNCKDYFYRVAAVDTCGKVGQPSPPAGSRTSGAGAEIKAPINVQAFFQGTQVRVTWDPVQFDVAGNAIYIENYRVCRTPVMSGPPPAPSEFTVCENVWNGQLEFLENVTWSSPKTVYYRVQAQDACINASVMSDPPAEPTCPFWGTVSLERPKAGESVFGFVLLEGKIVNGSGSYDRVTFRVVRLDNGQQVWQGDLDPPTASPPWSAIWPSPTPPPQPPPWLRISVEVVQDNGCSQVKSADVLWKTP